MTEPVPIRIPVETVNDDSVILLHWYVADGASVNKDQLIAEVETSKAVMEVYAPGDGVIQLVAEAGNMLPVGTVIAHLTSTANSAGLQKPSFHLESPEGEAPKVRTSASVELLTVLPDVRISRKAMELIQQHGLSRESFQSKSMIREVDVLEILEANLHTDKKEDNLYPAIAGIPLDGVSLPEAFHRTEEGKLDPEFLASVRKNRAAFSELSSELKCEEYRRHGAAIGSDVILGHRAVILSPQLVLGDRVQITANSAVECSERFIVGRLSSFREGLSIEGSTVLVGENVFGCKRIEISGGAKNPYAFLSIGDTTFLGDDLILDISRPILIGKEAFVTQRAIVITHNIGQSILEGFENRFEPVVLEDRCQIGMSTTVYAGSRIGSGAIVGSNSYVVSSIPPGKLALGVPARVVRNAARDLSREQQLDLVLKMVHEFRELLSLRGFAPSDVADGRFGIRHEDRQYQFAFKQTCTADDFTTAYGDEVVFWTFETASSVPQGCTVFNLLAKRVQGNGGVFAESAREFLRKRGIRCEPGPWRYSGGLI
jgi:acetyltransferase-like isoleucine patch superfamily enzyme